MYLKEEVARRVAAGIAAQHGLSVVFHQESPYKFMTGDGVIYLPDPILRTDPKIWDYGMYHEIQHNDARYRPCMYPESRKLHKYISNIVLDYMQEIGTFGEYQGKDVAVISGRELFLKQTYTEVSDESEVNILGCGLYHALDVMRTKHWRGYSPKQSENPKVIQKSKELLGLHEKKIEALVKNPSPEQLKAFVDELCTEVEAGQGEGEREAGQAGKLEVEFGTPDEHEFDNSVKGVHKQNKLGSAISSRASFGNKHPYRIPNISEQLQRLLVAKKLATFEHNKDVGKLRNNGIIRATQGELDIFSKKINTPMINSTVMLCIDCSSSMEGKKINAARDATAGMVACLQDLGLRYGIIFFESMVHIMKRPSEVLSTGEALNLASRVINAGSTCMISALTEAAITVMNEQNPVVIMIGDGEPTDGKLANLLLLQKEIVDAGIRVYNIFVDASYLRHFMTDPQIQACYIDNSSELPGALMSILEKIYAP